MNTELNKQHKFMIITVLAGLVLAALMALLPTQAEAGLRVTAIFGDIETRLATEGAIVQTGPRSYRCDIVARPPRPLRGQYVWVPGHFEQVLEIKNCRKSHGDRVFHPVKGRGQRPKRDHLDTRFRGRGPAVHDHYTQVWVPGRWERN